MDDLDNPIWSALTGPHAHLATGRGRARRYRPEISILGGLDALTETALADLRDMLPTGGEVALFTTAPVAPIPGLVVRMATMLDQMVARVPRPVADERRIARLGDADVPEMMRLVQLTEPGPFSARTIDLGTYLGIREGDTLAAMAGERLRFDGYTEVSAVCTHPGHRRKGLAVVLVSAVMNGILERGQTPLLHVLPHNAGAIAAYERLGFARERTLRLSVLKRDPAE